MGTDFSIEPAGAPVVEPANDTAAYRVVDNRTSLVPQPLPDQAARCRAYYRALGLAGRAPKRLLVTDRIA